MHPIPPKEPSWLTTGMCKKAPLGPAGVAGAWRGGEGVAWQGVRRHRGRGMAGGGEAW